MTTEQKIKQASNFTDGLLKYIITATKTKLNKDGKGCYVKSISISYETDITELEVNFSAPNSSEFPVRNFTCSSIL